MIYYNKKNREKFTEAIKNEARNLGIDLVTHDLDRSDIYYICKYKTLDSLVERIVEDIRGWFSDNTLNKKEMNVTVGNEPWIGENIRIQTRRKR